MKRNLLFLAVVCVFSVTAAWAQQAQSVLKANPQVVSPLVLYDNFNGSWIDPAKWYGPPPSETLVEVVRELSPSYQGQGNNRRLRLFARAYGLIGTEGIDYGGVGLWFTNAASIQEVSFDIVVNSASVSGCPENPSAGAANVGFTGDLFNYQGEDFHAGLDLIREGSDARAPLLVRAVYNNDGWTISDYRDLGYVPLGQTAKLRFKWDQPNHQFIFQLNNDPPVILAYGSAIQDTIPPTYLVRGLGFFNATPHCPSTMPGGAVIDAYFDNVFVNSQ